MIQEKGSYNAWIIGVDDGTGYSLGCLSEHILPFDEKSLIIFKKRICCLKKFSHQND